MNHEYVSVVGPMGAGKSTVEKLISRSLGWAPIDEIFHTNTWLSKSYDDPKTYAFRSQICFLGTIHSQTKIADRMRETTGVIQDSHITQYRYSYAEAQHLLHNIDDREWELYQSLYAAFSDQLTSPSLFVYLRAPIPVLLDRIAKRDRSFERKVDSGYVELLDVLLNEYLQSKENTVPVLTIETDGLDIVCNPQAQRLVVEQVVARLQYEKTVQ